MGFSDEGRIIMENLYVLKVMEQNNSKEFPTKGWGLRRLNRLF